MRKSLLAAGLSGILLAGSLAAPAIAREDSPTPSTSPTVVTDHSSSFRAGNIGVILLVLIVLGVVAAN